MPARRARPPATRRGRSRRPETGPNPARRWKWPVRSALVLLGLLAGSAWLAREFDRPRRRVEAAKALLAEGRSALALDRSAVADSAFARALELDPGLADAWQGRLDRLRVLDRPAEALRLGRVADSAVPAGSPGRRALLASTTLAVLAEVPDDQARDRLRRWLAADPADLDARVALLARSASNPHPGDPDRASRISELSGLLGRSPGNVAAREALAVALADSGEVEELGRLLDAWPEDGRDARFDRLDGRRNLDHAGRPDLAARAFAKAAAELPHDWKAHYGLARSLRALGRLDGANAEAEAVARLRERLEPRTLGPRLAGDLARLDDPASRLDLAGLCDGVGLADLARAWTREAGDGPTFGPDPGPGR